MTNGGPAEARNAGARVASGDVLVFLDADVAVHADTLEKIALRLGERPHLVPLRKRRGACLLA